MSVASPCSWWQDFRTGKNLTNPQKQSVIDHMLMQVLRHFEYDLSTVKDGYFPEGSVPVLDMYPVPTTKVVKNKSLETFLPLCTSYTTFRAPVAVERGVVMVRCDASEKSLESSRENPESPISRLFMNNLLTKFVFMQKYMPCLAGIFPHVLVDVSSITALCIRWFPKESAAMEKRVAWSKSVNQVRKHCSTMTKAGTNNIK
ncbi:Oligoribonuclease [Platanthera guangdongensis]|uniref:Oligoribonuclease n=1 Tax=Platanthera guangdongensis TaxID=2320717 RepID=A0ABR2LG90_9ASPA